MSGSLSEILKEYVLKLGYSEDEGSRRRMLDSIRYVGVKLAELALAAEAAAVAAAVAISRIASGVEQLGYIAREAGTSVRAIQNLDYSWQQFGRTAGEATTKIQALFRLFQSNPAMIGAYTAFTGKAYTGNAQEALENLMKRAAEMHQKHLAPDAIILSQLQADSGSILNQEDFNTALRQYAPGTRDYAAERNRSAGAIVGTPEEERKAEESLEKFQKSYRAMGEDFDLFMKTIAGKLAEVYGPAIDNLRIKLEANAPAIRNLFVGIGDKVKWMADQVTSTISGLISLVNDLGTAYDQSSPQMKRVIEGLEAIVGAWAAITAASKASPVVLIATAILALAKLYDDYKEFEKTGKSGLGIPWAELSKDFEAFTPVVHALGVAFEYLGQKIDEALGGLKLVPEIFKGWAPEKSLPQIPADVQKRIDDRKRGGSGAYKAPEPTLAPIHLGSFGADTGTRAPIHLGSWFGFGGGGGSSDGGGADKAAVNTNDPKVKRAMEILRGMGYAAAAAAGIVGNLYAESGLSTTVTSDGGQHVGIAQWGRSRQLMFQGMHGKPLSQASLQEQLEFLDWEMHHTETGAGMRLSNSNIGVDAASDAVTDYYERPGTAAHPNAEFHPKREGLSRAILQANPGIGGIPPGTGPMPAYGGGGESGGIVQNNTFNITSPGDPAAIERVVRKQMDVNADRLRSTAATPR